VYSGSLARAQWKVNKANRHLAEKAIDFYLRSFQMCSEEGSDTAESVGFGAVR
jgi:hypothetical protein